LYTAATGKASDLVGAKQVDALRVDLGHAGEYLSGPRHAELAEQVRATVALLHQASDFGQLAKPIERDEKLTQTCPILGGRRNALSRNETRRMR